MRLITTVSLLVAVLIAAAIVVLRLSSEQPIAAIAPPARASFSKDQVRKGAELAALGNCTSCHTAAGGRTFAGGRPLQTPFGTIYGTNITPDPQTGIGRWSEAAFLRALHEGVDREGRHLYPAFPYDHFTGMSDEDGRALYAYLMTQDPVTATAPANELTFPFGLRPLLAGWKLLFFTAGRFRGDPNRSAEAERGAYLVEAVAHCGACHTPRNSLGAEKHDQAFAGGVSQDWTAPALNTASPAPVPWTVDQLHAYLRTGHVPLHGAARGPMADVSQNLARVDDADVRAIAAYIGGLMGQPAPERERRARELMSALPRTPGPQVAAAGPETVGSGSTKDVGATIYAGACAACHDAPEAGLTEGLNLSLSTAMRLAAPDNFLQVVLHGIHPPEGEHGAIMPPFSAALTDRQIAELATFVRTRFGHQAAWPDVGEMLIRLRRGEARQ